METVENASGSIERMDRPGYHYTPPSGWMNDPNGLVTFGGEYHLFYQHLFPSHWGHAVSTDFLRWTDLPIALAPDERGFIASGSAVVDEHDTSGFFGGEPGLVAIFTHWRDDAQEQSIAYSADNGRTWTKYAGNPVVPNPGIRDFRDPKVFWHELTQQWVMLIAVRDRVHFYNSTNLRDWTFASEFGATQGSHNGVWECPDLIELPVDDAPGVKKWTLHISVNAPHGPTMQYFVGSFDGVRFANDNVAETVLWTDAGADFYAAVTWANLTDDDDRRVWIGWLNNWTYAKQIPTRPWQGMMSIPRQLGLKQTAAGTRLIQKPIDELVRLRRSEQIWSNEPLAPGDDLLAGVRGKHLEIIAEIDVRNAAAIGFKVRKKMEESVAVRYNAVSASISIDRSDDRNSSFSERFSAVHYATLAQGSAPYAGSNTLKMHIFLDECSIEVFVDDGETVISDLIFADPDGEEIELFAHDGTAFVKNLVVYQLANPDS